MLDIVRNNNATFYNYRTGAPSPVWRRVALTMFGALLLTIPFHAGLSTFLGSVATAQSILVGFSFNVLFFLVSSSNIAAPFDGGSLEKKLKQDKLRILSNELFYNVSYFNFVAIGSVLVSLSLLLPAPSLNWIRVAISAYADAEYLASISGIWAKLREAIAIALVFLFYFLMLESFLTFYRTAVRVSFFFGEKLKYDSTNSPLAV